MSFVKQVFRDKQFLKIVFTLALPIAFQSFLVSGLNMADNIMLGRLRYASLSADAPLAAVALCNQFFFLLVLLLFGISGSGAIFTARHWGSGELPKLKEAYSLALILNTILALLFYFGINLFIEPLLLFFKAEEDVRTLAVEYIRVVSISYPVMALTFTSSIIARSCEEVKLPMKVSILAVFMNITLNYLLIFGKMGFPALGVKGAALATLISRVTEAIVLHILLYRKRGPYLLRRGDLSAISTKFIKSYAKVATPVILNEGIWALGITAYMFVYSHIGKEAVSSFSIAETYFRIAVTIFFGTSSACATMIGNRIGAGEDKRAGYYANAYGILGLVFGVGFGLLLFLASFIIPQFYEVSEVVRRDARHIMWVFSFILPFRVFTWHMVVGVFRSGGDTLFSMFLDAGLVWAIGVPLALFSGLVLKVPVPVVLVCINIEEMVKFWIAYHRLKSLKWLKKI